tara:strand:+ start:1007 stop:1258 length:252 start_codon:yes stop_codon:yes gene_type:complete
MSDWIIFVKKVAKEKGIKYNEALKIASNLYHKERGTIKKPKLEKSGEKRLTGKRILRVLKRKIDNGELHKGLSKRNIVEILKN